MQVERHKMKDMVSWVGLVGLLVLVGLCGVGWKILVCWLEDWFQNKVEKNVLFREFGWLLPNVLIGILSTSRVQCCQCIAMTDLV